METLIWPVAILIALVGLWLLLSCIEKYLNLFDR
jgi:nitrogen fixation-related uncharacterized protein